MGLMLLLISLCLIGSCYSATITAPAYNSANAHWYQLVIPDTAETYNQASAYASSLTLKEKIGYLVTVTDAAEATFLRNTYFNKNYAYSLAYPASWTGAKKNIAEKLWYWHALDRRSSTFYNQTSRTILGGQYCTWASDEPTITADSDCGQVNFATATNSATVGLWTAKNCGAAVSSLYVVEYDTPSTTCAAGFSYTSNPYPKCDDINECSTPNKCGAGYTCENTLGSFSCKDINECETPGKCQAGTTCENKPGSHNCTDINECTQSPAVCALGTKCTNSYGGYSCTENYFKIKTKLSDLVLDLKIRSPAMGSPIVVAEEEQTDSQLWRLTPEGFVVNKIKINNNDLVMDIANDQVVGGNPVIVWERKSIDFAANQRWIIDADGGFSCFADATFVLDVEGGFGVPGNPCIIWWAKPSTAEDKSNQLFSLEYPAPTPTPTPTFTPTPTP